MKLAQVLFDEDYNQSNINWRKELDLPADQLIESKTSRKESKFNRPQLNAFRHLVANGELSFEDLQKKNQYEFERIFLAYFCLEGLSVPLAEGLKCTNDDLIFFMSLKSLVQKGLMSFSEIKNLNDRERRLFEKLLEKEGEKTCTLFAPPGAREFDIFSVYEKFQRARNEPIKKRLTETEIITSKAVVPGLVNSILDHSFYLDYCANNKTKSRQSLAILCASVGLEKSRYLKERAVEVIVEYIKRSPSCGQNLQIIADLTDKQLAKPDDNQQQLQLINQVAKEILSLTSEPALYPT